MRSEAFLAACVALCLIAGCSNSSTEGARPEEASGRVESLEKVPDRGVTTTALSATTTTPTAASTTTMTPMNSDLMLSPVIDLTGVADASGYDWGGAWRPDLSLVGCGEQSGFSVSQLSPEARLNLELVTNKNIEDVTAADLGEIIQLRFSDALYFYESDWYEAPEYLRPEGLVSYDGLEHLACLQWLDLGNQNFGRDFRFLTSLTDLRYLNLSLAFEFQDVELLKLMTKLESLVLPQSFQSLKDLAQLTSLRRISARASQSCNVEPLLGMSQLETLLLGGNSDFQNWVEITELDRDFDVSVDSTGRYMQLLIEGGASAFNPEFDLENLGGIYDSQYVMDVVQSIYEIANDVYDVIIFVGNVDTSDVSYSGFARQVGNNVDGLGAPVWSSASCFGSAGRLRGVVSIPAFDGLWQDSDSALVGTAYGSLIHEVLHLWGGGNLLPATEDLNGNIVGGHWGVSSANGILGGFDLKSLSMVEDGTYRVDYFSDIGNSNLDLFLSPLELYMMGVLPSNEVPDTAVFSGVSQVNDAGSCEDYGYQWWDGKCFTAARQTMVSIEDIIDVFGERPYEREVDVSLLVVAVSEDPLTEAEWSRIDKRISWYAEPSAVNDFNNNMWEASLGKVRFKLPLPNG